MNVGEPDHSLLGKHLSLAGHAPASCVQQNLSPASATRAPSLGSLPAAADVTALISLSFPAGPFLCQEEQWLEAWIPNPPFCVGSQPHLEENLQQLDPSSVVPSANDCHLLSLSAPLCKVGRD